MFRYFIHRRKNLIFFEFRNANLMIIKINPFVSKFFHVSMSVVYKAFQGRINN